MQSRSLKGVIAAIVTPFDAHLEPDTQKLIRLGRHLLSDGCDGLNLCGTTGEATSMSVSQRSIVMSAAAGELPLDRMMVGTGASALADASDLTLHAGRLGFAGALLLPPFYYKDVPGEGIVSYFVEVARRSEAAPAPLYLYNFPALSGIPFTPKLVALLRDALGSRLAGLKDSSGDLAYARDLASGFADLDIFPSDEAVLIEARSGVFAGCISATANVTSAHAQRAFADGDIAAAAKAFRIRNLIKAYGIIPASKAAVATMMGDAGFLRLLQPNVALPNREEQQFLAELGRIIAG